jgi:membrane protease YdiL (CAAX protease family)
MPAGEAVKAGLKAVGLWTATEFAIRGVLLVAVGIALLASGILSKESVGSGAFLGPATVGTLALALVVLVLIFGRRIRREGLEWQIHLGYRFGRRELVAGVVCGALLLVLIQWGASYVDEFLFPGGSRIAEMLLKIFAEAGPVTAAALLVVNGILAPVVEEFAWRGYIQYRLTQGWGASMGLAATALLFSAKHVVVDVSLSRTTSLVVGSFALGLIRQRWGTGASTAAHVTLNFTATLMFLLDALSPPH